MKIKTFFLLFLSIVLFACNDIDNYRIPSPSDIVPDPEGTVLISILNRSNGNNSFKEIRISDAGNLYGDNWTFSGLGNMMGLGNVVNIPQSGYVTQYLARTGYGYVGKENIINYHRSSYECNFIRFWVEYASEIGAEIKYQYPFIGQNRGIQFVSEEIILENTNSAQEIVEFKEMVPFKATLTSGETVAHEWLNLSSSEKGAFSVVVKSENKDASPRNATITIKGSNSESKIIKVIQQGAAPFISIPENQKKISVASTASNGVIILTANTDWSISSDVSWCTVAPLLGSKNANVTYSIQQNNSGEKRIANITFSAQGIEDIKIAITQDLSFSGGNGSIGNPYIITNAEQLALVSQYSSQYFRMTKNINLSEYLKNSAAGWTPFSFSGNFDGNDYTISGLWIDRPSDQYVGLFSQFLGKISNLKVKISSKGISGGVNTGGIAGISQGGYITNCSVEGKIMGTGYTGGIIGFASWGSISNCKYNGTISGINTGGIAGYNSSTINNSYSQGNINGTIVSGGLVGISYYSKLLDSYSTAKVYVNGFNYACYAGGIVGQGGCTISRCYYAGILNVTFSAWGSERKAGIAGEGSISSSFYDSSIAGTNIVDSSNGRTTTQMKQKATYTGWDFDTIWNISEGVSYPTLSIAN